MKERFDAAMARFADTHPEVAARIPQAELERSALKAIRPATYSKAEWTAWAELATSLGWTQETRDVAGTWESPRLRQLWVKDGVTI